MATRWTGYTSGTQNLLSSVIENKKLALETQAQADTASYRKQVTEFAEAEKRRDDKFRSDTLTYRAEERERADEIAKKRIERDESRDTATAKHRTAVLSGMITTSKQKSMADWGVDVLDEKGQPIPTTIVDPNDPKKRIPNPTLVARGANFSLDGTRLISTQEAVLDTKVRNYIDQSTGLDRERLRLAKINESKIAPIDPLLFDPEESRWWGFDEEDALDDLRNKAPNWGKTVDLMSVLPEDNAKRIHVLSSIQKLHSELVGKKYASATGGLALESGKYGKIRSSLASQLEGYINSLGGEIDQDSGLISKVGEETSYEGVSFKDAPRAERGRRDMLKRKLREISQKESGSPLTAEERSYIRETGQIPDRLISAYNSGAY